MCGKRAEEMYCIVRRDTFAMQQDIFDERTDANKIYVIEFEQDGVRGDCLAMGKEEYRTR